MLKVEPMSADRRRAIRVACDLPVTWRRAGRGIATRAVDVSPRGLLIVSDVPIAVPFMMDLAVSLPTGVIEVFGVARFCGRTRFGDCIGVSLMAMTPDENERWWAYYRTAAAATQPRTRAA